VPCPLWAGFVPIHGGDHKMKGRVTVSFDERLIVMLRRKQSEIMLDENRQISISGVVSELLIRALKREGMIIGEFDFECDSLNGMRFPVDKN